MAFSILGQGESRTARWLSDRLSLTTYDLRLTTASLRSPAHKPLGAPLVEDGGDLRFCFGDRLLRCLLHGGGAGHHVRYGWQGEDFAGSDLYGSLSSQLSRSGTVEGQAGKL